MLQRSLHELAVGTLLGSSALTELLAHRLNPTKQPTQAWLSDDDLVFACRRAIAADLDARWPRAFRLNELESITAQVCPKLFLRSPDLPVLDALFNELMEVNGELVCFRIAHVQAYIRMSAEVEPAAIVGWYLAGLTLRADGSDPRRFERMVSMQSSFFGPRSFEHSPVAENHAHLGGTFGDGAVLSMLILAVDDNELSRSLANVTFAEDQNVLHRVKRARSLVRELLGIWRQSPSDIKPEDIAQSLERASSPEVLGFINPSQLHWPTFLETIDVGPFVDSRWLVMALSRSLLAFDLQTAWLWLFVALWRNYRNPKSSLQERAAILSVINDFSLLRRRLVMDGRGLRRFTERHYNPSMRGLVRESATLRGALDHDVARRVFVQPSDLAELKIAPSGLTPRIANALACAIDGHQEDPMRGLLLAPRDGSYEAFRAARKATFDRWHFCVHFSRSGNAGRANRRAKLWDEAKALQQTCSSHSIWNAAGLLGGNEHRDFHVEPGHFLRGLDVAGDETKWPIEIFAPALRWLRKTHLAQGSAKRTVLKPHLSIHAGEDYAHVLSGIRHIDETVRFCAMENGDRLGHALAIGVSPQQWFARHGDALLDVDEHLDNLVWAWSAATRLTARLPLAVQVIPRLEQRIQRFLRHASWMRPAQSSLLAKPPSSFSWPEPNVGPTELYDAWLLRRNCGYLILREDPQMPLIDLRMLEGAPDYERLFAERRSPGNDVAAMLYLRRVLQERERQRQPSSNVLVKAYSEERRHQDALEQQAPTSTNLLYDHEELEEIEFMQALQDHLLDEYERLGLVLETNPTSNVYIGPLHTYREHPLFRWNPPNPDELKPFGTCNRFALRRGAIPVTVNTDDQGIMPTTLRTELHLMREAAVDRGASGVQADEWIDRIRQAGLEQFKRNHSPVFELR